MQWRRGSQNGGGVGRGLDLTKKKVFFGMVMYNFAKKELEGAGGGGGGRGRLSL